MDSLCLLVRLRIVLNVPLVMAAPCNLSGSCIPSLFKKYLMALTGFVMVGFVLVHMMGNLQMFRGPDAINQYAHFLKTLPGVLLWGMRGLLIVAIGVHVWMAILLTKENRAARPQGYLQQAVVRATWASRTMGVSGSLLLFFIVFHVLHFTTRVIFPEYQMEDYYTLSDGDVVFNVYQMVVDSFSKPWVTGFYIFAMGALCLHLSHAVWSMFQTLGWANTRTRPILKGLAKIYGWVIFIGFVAVPLGVISRALPPMLGDEAVIILSIEAEPFDSESL